MNRIIIHCGEGRGKTSSAVGTVLRSLAHGRKVFAAQFFKPAADAALKAMQQAFPGNITVKNYGNWHFINNPDPGAAAVMNSAVEEITAILHREEFDTILLDEIFYAVQFKLLDVQSILDILNGIDGKYFIMTGRYAPPELLAVADTISEIKCIKHAFDQGIKAQKGIEF